MIATPDLINALATNLAPVRRLRSPVVRAACWLMLAAIVVALLAVAQGIRPDLAQRLHYSTFVGNVAGATLTGILGAIAAFMLSLPDRSRFWILLPVPGLGLWLSTIGYQCLTNWIVFEPSGVTLGEAAQCLATVVLTSLPLSLAMLVMLRYAAPLRPVMATFAGSLAVSAIAAMALSLFHRLDASLMILAWNFGTTFLLVAAATIFGDKIFSWVGPQIRRIQN